MKQEKYRMYFLVPYNISEIAKGIQCGHAALEYANKFSDDKVFKRFVEYDKTWIILNGGISNHNYHDKNSKDELANGKLIKIKYDEKDLSTIGTMEQHWNFLQEMKINSTYFLEPDANNMMTSICLIVPNSVFNREDYPDFHHWIHEDNALDTVEKIKLKEMHFGTLHDGMEDLYKKYLNMWYNRIGGEKYGKLRLFLNQFKLA